MPWLSFRYRKADGRWGLKGFRHGYWRGLCLAVVFAGMSTLPVQAQEAVAAEPPTVAELAARLKRLEETNQALAAQNQQMAGQLQDLMSRYDELSRRGSDSGPGPGTAAAGSAPAAISRPAPSSSLPALLPDEPLAPLSELAPAFGPQTVARPPAPLVSRYAVSSSRFIVGEYDDDRGQFVLVRPKDAQRVPFEVRLDLYTEARYTNFAPSAEVWVDSTGAVQPIRSLDSVEVTRNFVQFQGFALDPRLQYTAILFSSTALNDTVYLGWLNYRFSEALDVRVGNWVIPGTREWYESFRWTMGADRLMATTFFRPNISPGIWAQGQPFENFYYVAMVANSLNRFTQGIQRTGSSRAFGGSVWWEPLGAFGLGPSDIENHSSPVVRLGANTAISSESNQGFSPTLELSNPEDTIVRLSDGTPLFRSGALGPGVDLVSTNLQLFTIDGAIKYRGFGLSGEYFFRSLNGFRATGAQPIMNSLFDHGGLLQGSYFLRPNHLELFARTSFVTGRFGTGNEYGAGLNWYPQGKRTWRYTFEVLRINDSPAQNLLTGYRAGESGTLFQLQWFSDF